MAKCYLLDVWYRLTVFLRRYKIPVQNSGTKFRYKIPVLNFVVAITINGLNGNLQPSKVRDQKAHLI